MNIWKAVSALILTPFVALGATLVIILFLSFVEIYGEEILGLGFLLGWLALIFSIVYKLLQ